MRKVYLLFISLIFTLLLQGQQNNHVVISQIFSGGGNTGAPFNADYVELYNPTSSPVSLTGWSIQYSSSTTALWLARSLSGTIGAGRYFLIRMTDPAGTAPSLPAHDFSFAPEMNIALAGGEVALVNSVNVLADGCTKPSTIVDLLGFGNAQCFETLAAPSITNAESLYRLEDGCKDSDNNSADFIKGSPHPRNSASPGKVCGAPVAKAATGITINSFIANWEELPGATSYFLDVLRDGSSPDPTISTIVGWTFPTDGTTLNADIANDKNSESKLTTNVSEVSSISGPSSKAASASPWTDGANLKYWQIIFDATGYSNITLSSQQRSTGKGPRDFKVQYKIGTTETWIDIPTGGVTLATDWTTGVLSNLRLPQEINNKPQVSIRWLMTTNVSVDNTTVNKTGNSSIDNIYLKGNGTLPVEFVPGYENLEVTGTSKTVEGLSQGTRYYYRVRAKVNGTLSANSNTITLQAAMAGALPVVFSNVNALKWGSKIVLEWTNNTEINVAFYEVERSHNRINYVVIGRVEPNQNMGGAVHYNFMDEAPLAKNFYRIKAVETSGTQTFSGS